MIIQIYFQIPVFLKKSQLFLLLALVEQVPIDASAAIGDQRGQSNGKNIDEGARGQRTSRAQKKSVIAVVQVRGVIKVGAKIS